MLVCISSYRITQLYLRCITGKKDVMMDSQTQDILDYRGLKCPLPVLKARRALKQAQTGDIITIWADDPASPLDMAHFCSTEGHSLSDSEEDSYFIFEITKG